MAECGTNGERGTGNAEPNGEHRAAARPFTYVPRSALRVPHSDHAARRTASVTLWPPNPKEFDSATLTGRCTALLGAESRSQAGSGVNWLMVGGMIPLCTTRAHTAA